MPTLEPRYTYLGKASMQKEYPEKNCRYFVAGFVTALVVTLICGAVFQLCVSSQGTLASPSQSQVSLWPRPPHDQVAKVARYVVHISDWASLATISTADPIRGFPFANIISISDGTLINATGTPYAYITYMDLSGKDLMKDARATLSLSEAQSDYCHTHDYDPESPLCARVLLSGYVKELKNGTSEAEFAENALFSRHPEMKDWPKDHNWIFVKLEITHIFVLDYFGGAADVPIEDYYNAHL